MTRCRKLESTDFHAVMIKGALHNDIYTLEKTFNTVTEKLEEWFK
jgi:hypothetical protein